MASREQPTLVSSTRGGRVGRGFRAAAGRRRGLLHKADFVRRQAVEVIDPLVDFALQS
jgi:hypothetical protein